MSIKIKPSKKGSLHKALGIPQGEKIPASKLKVKESDSPALKKKKVFAANARKWDKAEGGISLQNNPKYFQPTNTPQSFWDNTQYLEPLSYTPPPVVEPGGKYNPLPLEDLLEDYDKNETFSVSKKPNLHNIINLGLSVADTLTIGQQPKQNKLKANEIENPNFFSQGAPVNNNQGVGQSALAKEGMSLKKYPDGGKVKNKSKQVEPIIVNNPNDPRLRAYNDSLNLYNASVKTSNIIKPGVNDKFAIEFLSKNIIDNPSITKSYKNLNSPKGKKVEVLTDRNLPVYYTNFKKPVQPVVYQKEPVEDFKVGKYVNLIDNSPIEAPPEQDTTSSPIQQFPKTSYKPTGNPIYHPNGDLIGFSKEGDFQKLESLEGLKPETKKWLENEENINNYMKSQVGDYYKGIKKMKNGGNVSQYSNSGLYIENNNFTPISPSTYMLDGNYHKDGGTDIAYYGTKVEAEKGESISIDEENNLIIFGNRTVPGTNKKYKTLAKEIGKEENKYQKKMNLASNILETSDKNDKWESLKFNAGTAMLIGSNAELDNLQDKKNKLGKLQEIQNIMFPEKTAKKGKTLKAPNGETINSLWNYENNADGFTEAANNNLLDMYEKAKTAKKGKDVLEFQQEFHKIYPEFAKNLLDKRKSKTSYAKSKGYDKLDLRGNEDSIFGETTEQYKNFILNQKPSNPTTSQTATSTPNLEPLPPLTEGKKQITKTEVETDPVYNFNITQKENEFKRKPYDWKNNAGELFSLGYNPTPVNYSTISPELQQPYQVSFQDRRNQVQSNLKTANLVNVPVEAQYAMQGQASENLQSINADEFRTNQGIYANVINNNNQILNQAKQYNAGKYDLMSENAAANRFNKFAVTKSALQSMAQKSLQHEAGQNELEAFQAMHPQYVYNQDQTGVDYAGNPNAMLQAFGKFLTNQKSEKKSKPAKDGAKISPNRLMKLMN